MKRLSFVIILINLVGIVNAQNTNQIISSLSSYRNADTISIRLEIISPKNGYIVKTKSGENSFYETNYKNVDFYYKKINNNMNSLYILQKPNKETPERHLFYYQSNIKSGLTFLPQFNKVYKINSYDPLIKTYDPLINDPICLNDVIFGHELGTNYSYILSNDELLFNGIICKKISIKLSNLYIGSMELLIGKENGIIYKNIYYDYNNKKTKTFELLEQTIIQERIIPIKYKISFPNEEDVIIQIQIIKFNDPIPNRVFTKEFLETGK